MHTLYSLKYEFNCLVMSANFGLIKGFSIQQEDINPYLQMRQESMFNFIWKLMRINKHVIQKTKTRTKKSCYCYYVIILAIFVY